MGNFIRRVKTRENEENPGASRWAVIEVNSVGSNTWRQLHDAIIRCDIQECKVILGSHGGNVDSIYGLANQVNHGGQISYRTLRTPPLHLACMFRRRAVVQLFLADGQASPTCLDNFGRPPAMLVLQYWPRIPYDRTMVVDNLEPEDAHFWKTIADQHYMSLACMTMLLERGIDVSGFLNYREETLLHVCARYNLTLAINLLVSYNADLEARDIDGCTPLMLAVKLWRPESVEEFLQQGADVKTTDRGGRTIFHRMCSLKRVSVSCLAHFMHIGLSDIDKGDIDGNTLLHTCILNEEWEKLEFLLKCGANPDLKNNNGQTVLFLVLDSRYDLLCSSIPMVLSETCRICVLDQNGELPRGLAGDTTASKLIREKLLSMSKNPPSLYSICLHRVQRILGAAREDNELVMSLQCPESIRNNIGCLPHQCRIFWSPYMIDLING